MENSRRGDTNFIFNEKNAVPWSEYCASDLLHFPHHMLAEHTLHRKAIFSDRKPFPFRTSRLMPFIPPSAASADTSSHNGDLVSSLVHQKSEWKNRLDRLSKWDSYIKKEKDKYQYGVDLVQTALSTQQNEVLLLNRTVEFLEFLGQDPDSDFSGPTNWYYAGGRLSQITVDDQSILLTSSGKNNEKLSVVALREEPPQGWQPVLDGASHVATTSNTAIHQIVGKTSKEVGFIGVLQKNLCSLHTLKRETDSFELRGWHCATSTEPFTSLDISGDYCGRYCTSSVNRQAILWDAFSGKCIQSDVVAKPKYKVAYPWSSIQFLGPHTLVMADTCSVSWLDVRMPLSNPSMVYYPRDEPSILTTCEDVSLVFPSSPSDETLFIGSSHHLLHFDYRNAEVSQRWTHMLRSPPIYAQTWKTNDETVICIANQEPAEVEICINKVSETNCESTILPYLLPTLHESLHLYHMDGLFLDPRVQQRLKMSLTGLTCISSSNGETAQILIQTTLGDIFCHELGTTEIAKTLSPENVEHLKVWEQSVMNRPSNCGQRLKITGEHNFSRVCKSLKSAEFKKPPYQREAAIQECLRSSKKELLSYVDFLAPKLLSAWDIVNVPEWGGRVPRPVRAVDQPSDMSRNNVEFVPRSGELLEPIHGVLRSAKTSRLDDSVARENVDEVRELGACQTPVPRAVNKSNTKIQGSRRKSKVSGF